LARQARPRRRPARVESSRALISCPTPCGFMTEPYHRHELPQCERMSQRQHSRKDARRPMKLDAQTNPSRPRHRRTAAHSFDCCAATKVSPIRFF
jgi:hypothetical protein